MTGIIQTHVVDIQVDCHGSVFVLTPLSPIGREWVQEHVAITDETQHWAGGIVVEHRYVSDIVNGALEDGLRVAGS